MAEYVRQDHHLPHGSLEPHITNGDRLRMMTDEELAEFLMSPRKVSPKRDQCVGCLGFECADCVLEWLRKEADEKTIRKTEENADTFQQS